MDTSPRLVYLNNASTTYPKLKCVMDSVMKSLSNPPNGSTRSCDCIKRENDSDRLCRDSLSKFFKLYKDYYNVILTPGSTYSLNMVINSFDDNFRVLTTTLEHNSVYRPIHSKTSNIKYLKLKNDDTVDIDDLEKSIQIYNPDIVCINHMSNVNGVVQDLPMIVSVCKRYNTRVLFDISQSAGSVDIDLSAIVYDKLYMAGTGHKNLNSLEGIGFLILPSEDTFIKPLVRGGTGDKSHMMCQPNDNKYEYLESGTPNYIAIDSLIAGIKMVSENIQSIRSKKKILSVKLLYSFKYMFPFAIKVVAPVNNESGIVSFTLTDRCKKHTNKTLAETLETKYGIVVREGLHCAPLFLSNKPEFSSTIRVSIGAQNVTKDIMKLICSLMTEL